MKHNSLRTCIIRHCLRHGHTRLRRDYITCLFLLATVLSCAVIAQETEAAEDGAVPDVQSFDFETNQPPLAAKWVVFGFPDGKKLSDAEMKLSLGGNGAGKRCLSFTYKRTSKPSIPVIVNHVPLIDLESLSFGLKSRKTTIIACCVTDNDGATFSRRLALEAGKWKRFTLTPKEFACNDDSPVKKDSLEPSALGYNYALVDLFCIIGKDRGENSLYIDDVSIKRKSLKLHKGDYIVSGKKTTINEPIKIEGHLMVANGGELVVDSRRFEVGKNIIVTNNSKLVLKNGFWVFHQAYRYQHSIMAVKNSRIELENGQVSCLMPYTAGCVERSSFKMTNVEFKSGSLTFGIHPGTSLEMDGVKKPGEFVILDDSKLTIKNCEDTLLWLYCRDVVKEADFSLPKDTTVKKWSVPKELKRTMTIENSKGVIWGLIANNGCDVTVRDSEFRAVGVHYTKDTRSKISGIENGSFYKDFKLASDCHTLRFINTRVKTWNFYTGDTAQLEIRDCIFGETISFKKSRMDIYDSICDGTGGYFGAKEDSTTTFTNGRITCEVLTHDNSNLIIKESSIKGMVNASGKSKISLIDTRADGAISELGQGRVEKE